MCSIGLAFPTSVNDILRKKIEKIRKQMPCGIADGPPLVPFKQNLVNVDYNMYGVRYVVFYVLYVTTFPSITYRIVVLSVY